MSIILNSSGVLQPPKSTLLTTTGLTTVWTPGDLETMVQLILANSSAGAVACSTYWNDGSTDWLLLPRSVPANDHLLLEPVARLLSGHLLKVQAASANVITVTVMTTKSMRNVAGGER